MNPRTLLTRPSHTMSLQLQTPLAAANHWHAATSTTLRHSRRSRLLPLVACLAVLLLTACNGLGGGSSGTTSTPTPVAVNGFGTALNHEHSLLALPNHVLLLATHFGLFRSDDSGKSWKLVAAGPNQVMDGLMTFWMQADPLNMQRVYVLTQTRYTAHKAIIGLYTSDDAGQTWKLAVSQSAMGGTINFVQPGNTSPDEVYIYVPALGAAGLKVSQDDGEHFSNTGTLPFGTLTGLLAIPGAPGQLLAYGDEGMARSEDSGQHWQVLPGLNSAVFSLTTSGPHQPLYASGDAGIYASQDAGKSFTLVYQQASYGSLIASPIQPLMLYGKTARNIYQSIDGGKTWNMLPPVQGNLGSLAPDPVDSAIVYLSFSYPVTVSRFDQQSKQWSSLTPNA